MLPSCLAESLMRPGGPLHDVTVELRHEGGPKVLRKCFTDHSGIFRFTDLDAGTYQLSLYCPGFHTVNVRRTLSQGERIAVSDVVLQVAPIGNCPGLPYLDSTLRR